MQNVLNVTRILQKEFEDDAWRIESPRSLNLLKKLQSTGQSLGEYVNGKFYRGIVTGCNNAFVVDHITKERLIKEHDSSKDILKPFIRGRDVKRWNIDKPDLWLIFTRRGVDINTYPAIHNYLKKYKERLKSGVKGGRKPGKYEWFEIQDSIAYHEQCKKPKIVYQEIAT